MAMRVNGGEGGSELLFIITVWEIAFQKSPITAIRGTTP